MPIYHFNIADHSADPDPEGTELPDDATARAEAVVFAGTYLRDKPELILDGHNFRVEVTDKRHDLLFMVNIQMIDVVQQPK
ncbi:hypothetical protein BH09PSE4_BH09PSE4_11140 [soil metagenome]